MEGSDIKNLSSITRFKEEEIVRVLKERYMQGEIYTYAGPALISMNPHRELKSYSERERKLAEAIEEFPHIFDIAEKARVGAEHGTDQVVVLSGESGSGKTVNANYIIEYLSWKEENKSVGKKLIYTGPILELFGNAITKNNENSSRFGKYIEMFYGREGMEGARIKGFLLEKGRASDKEENFHVIKEIKAFMMGKENKIEDLIKNFKNLGVKKAAVLMIFKVIFGVIDLIDVVVKDIDGECEVNACELEKIEKNLGIAKEEIKVFITEKKIKVGKELIIKRKTYKEGVAAKSTLIRVMYESVFSYLIDEINIALDSDESVDYGEYTGSDGAKKIFKDVYEKNIVEEERAVLKDILECKKIGVLDIYGFEIMDENCLDQLCINYANEKIQSEYLKRIVFENRKAFEEEGIEIDVTGSLPQSDAIFEGSLGLVKMLDEESFLPSGSVDSFLQKISSLGSVRARNTSLEINHYAGKVEYETKEFIDKNRNRYSDVYELLNKSTVKVLHSNKSCSGKMSQRGIMGEFQQNLHSLLEEINKCNLHYVRCIKPKKNGEFCDSYVREQLRLTGIFETIKIFMMGFYIKMTHDEFMERYNEDARGKNVQVGKKYVFLTEKEYTQLEKEKQEKHEENLRRIEKEKEQRAIKIIKHYLMGKVILQREIQRKLDEVKKQVVATSSNGNDQYNGEDSTEIAIEEDIDVDIAIDANTPLPHTVPSLCGMDSPSDVQSSDDCIRVINKDNTGGCSNCEKVEEKYMFQTRYLTEREKKIESLTNQLNKANELLKEKTSLVQELSEKIEVLLNELSSGEYQKVTTNPYRPTESTIINLVSEKKEVTIDLFKSICKIYIHAIPTEYNDYYQAVSCAFALFRISAICPKGITSNLEMALRAFESSARTVLFMRKAPVPLSVGFFITNALFIARTFPGTETSNMLQGIFFEGCRVITDEIIGFTMEFLFKSTANESTSILSRLLKRTTIGTVISHLKTIHSLFSKMFVPSYAISSLFEYIAKVIDTQTIEYIIKKDKKIDLKQILQLQKNIDELSSLFSDLSIHNPFSHFIYIKAFIQLISMQQNEISHKPILLQLGIFTSSQIYALITSLTTQTKSESLIKLENALKETIDTPEPLTSPFPYLTIPVDTPSDNPTLLCSALCTSPESVPLIALLKTYGLPTDWLTYKDANILEQ